jgi:hypothetical protein
MARFRNDVDIQRIASEGARLHRVLAQHDAQYDDVGYQRELGCLGAAQVAQSLNLELEGRGSLLDPVQPLFEFTSDTRVFIYPADVEAQIDIIRDILPKLLYAIGYDDSKDWLGCRGAGIPLLKSVKGSSEGARRELDVLRRAVDALDEFIEYANKKTGADPVVLKTSLNPIEPAEANAQSKQAKSRGRQPKGVLKIEEVSKAINARLDALPPGSKPDACYIASKVQEETGKQVKALDVTRRIRTRQRRPSKVTD